MTRRTGSVRDRRGRGPRGPQVLPGPLTPAGVPALRTRRDRFDELVLDAVGALEPHLGNELAEVEFVVEEVPVVPPDWAAPTVPLASLLPGDARQPTRLVVFRQPLELRAESPADLAVLVHSVVVEQVAELLGRPPEDIDPGYRGD